MPVFTSTQFVKTDIDTCWSFFSDPRNLSVITPKSMNFRILFPSPMPAMYPGIIIQYKVSPLLNIPMEWITEISHVSKPAYFVDLQLKGPYRLWHHQHLFEKVEGGIQMTDIVTYELPFGKFGEFLAGRFVHKKVAGIFEYRSKVIDSFFK